MSCSIRKDAKREKVVFKPILQSPYRVSWPVIDNEIQQRILSELCEVLQGDDDSGRKTLGPFISIGLNMTTRRIQKLNRNQESIVLIPKFDLAPSHLYSHIPIMIGTMNAKHGTKIRLLDLPFGSEEKLKDTLGMKHVGAIGLFGDSGNEKVGRFLELVREQVGVFTLPWINGEYQPTTIKRIQTTMTIKSRKK